LVARLPPSRPERIDKGDTDAPHAAQGIAKKVVLELEKARAVQAAQANQQEALSAQH